MRKAVLAGASGLIGSSLLELLMADNSVGEIVLLVRKELPISHSKVKQEIVSFNDETILTQKISGDVFFCCLGTTKAKTPDKKEYTRIEKDIPLCLGKIAYNNGIKEFHFISSIGANKNASGLYLRLKGETEEGLKEIGFSRLYLYRTSLLIGKRNEYRPLEKIGFWVIKLLSPLLLGPLKEYKSISASIVASALFKNYKRTEEGTFTLSSNEIKERA